MKKKIYTIASYNHDGIGGPAYRVAMGADPCMAEIRAALPAEVKGLYLEIVGTEKCSPDTAVGILTTGETRVHVTRYCDWIECAFVYE